MNRQPYQRASQAIRQGEEFSLDLIQNAAMAYTGGKVAKAGFQAVNKLLPAVGAFLSNYVPEDLAIKGLNKINPGFGKFIQGAMDEGHTFEDVKNFIGEKVQKTQEAEKKNIIENHSPELQRFLESEIKNGRSPIQAGALAQMEKSGKKGFKSVIEKLEKEHKIPWSSILEMVFGKGDMGQQGQQEQQEQQQPSQQMQGQPQAQQQGGPGQAQLMQILQKLQQARGG